jgi:outer membrane lipoprotein-sorting protein
MIYTLYLDPDKSYALAGRDVELPKSSKTLNPSRGVQRVVEYAQPEPGLFIPTRIRMTNSGDPDGLVEVRVKNLRVNQPIDNDRLKLEFPAGLKVDDLRNGPGISSQLHVGRGTTR